MDNLKNLVIFLLLYLFTITNDYFRLKGKFNDSNIKYYTSIVVSIAMGGILKFFVSGYMEVYLYVMMAEIPWIVDRRAVKILYALDIFTMFFASYCRLLTVEGVGILDLIRQDFIGIVINILLISFISVCMFSYVALVIERNKVLKLNKEIEKLTIAKERNRIAQEIHDNLGHNLVALNMNLDVMYNLIDKDVDKTKELLRKSQAIAKESMKSLRKAVYTLKEEELSQGLKIAIERLIDNINDTSNIIIRYNVDEKLEHIPFEQKFTLYAIVKEAITNSIKHSKCSEIDIDIHIKDEIRLSIKDNGMGCSNFIKGNGIKGIEERIMKINGTIQYSTKEGQGFEISAILPL